MKKVNLISYKLFNRRYASHTIKCKSLQFTEYGKPMDCLSLVHDNISFESNPSNLLIKILAAPINPSDINKIEGVYVHKPSFPAIGGGEGVGKVIEIGENNDLKVGDKVVFMGNSLGTWRDYGIFKREHVYKIPPLHTIAASMLLINPCTAYSLLKNIIKLKPGDVIIQNGANSAVGQFVIQLAHIFGINTINIIRNRHGVEEVISYLQRLGANCVFMDDEMTTEKTGSIIDRIGKPKLALNCVGGQNCLNMIKFLQNNGTLVTYGGMSKKPVIIPTTYLIFKNIRAVGFFFSDSNKVNSPEFDTMINEICKYFNSKLITLPHYKTFKLEEYKDAIENSLKPYNMNKSIFVPQ